ARESESLPHRVGMGCTRVAGGGDDPRHPTRHTVVKLWRSENTMQSLIGAAVGYAQETELKEYENFGEPKIVIVGCGGAGGNTVNRLHKVGVRGAETIAINT